jgi:hypothetical protein
MLMPLDARPLINITKYLPSALKNNNPWKAVNIRNTGNSPRTTIPLHQKYSAEKNVNGAQHFSFLNSTADFTASKSGAKPTGISLFKNVRSDHNLPSGISKAKGTSSLPQNVTGTYIDKFTTQNRQSSSPIEKHFTEPRKPSVSHLKNNHSSDHKFSENLPADAKFNYIKIPKDVLKSSGLGKKSSLSMVKTKLSWVTNSCKEAFRRISAPQIHVEKAVYTQNKEGFLEKPFSQKENSDFLNKISITVDKHLKSAEGSFGRLQIDKNATSEDQGKSQEVINKTYHLACTGLLMYHSQLKMRELNNSSANRKSFDNEVKKLAYDLGVGIKTKNGGFDYSFEGGNFLLQVVTEKVREHYGAKDGATKSVTPNPHMKTFLDSQFSRAILDDANRNHGNVTVDIIESKFIIDQINKIAAKFSNAHEITA